MVNIDKRPFIGYFPACPVGLSSKWSFLRNDVLPDYNSQFINSRMISRMISCSSGVSILLKWLPAAAV